MSNMRDHSRNYLLFSDFDQTLSFHDSGNVLSEILGVQNFQERVEGLSQIHLVHRSSARGLR